MMRYRSPCLTLLALLIAAPAFAQVPNYQHVVEEMARQYPDAWHHAHRGGPRTEEFVRLLTARLHQIDPNIGLNGKRGNPNDISDDALNYKGVSVYGDVDPTRGNAPVTVIDFIGGAPSDYNGPDGTPAWNAVTDPKVRPTLAAWVQPSTSGPAPPTPTPTPTPTPQPPAPVDLGPVLAKLDALAAQLEAVRATQVEQSMSAALTLEAAQRAAHNAEQGALAVLEVKNWLDSGLLIELRVPTFGGTARGTARRPE